MAKTTITAMVEPKETSQGDLDNALDQQGLERISDGKDIVRWAATNPRHPRNWAPSRKAWDLLIIILLEFYTLVLLFYC